MHRVLGQGAIGRAAVMVAAAGLVAVGASGATPVGATSHTRTGSGAITATPPPVPSQWASLVASGVPVRAVMDTQTGEVLDVTPIA